MLGTAPHAGSLQEKVGDPVARMGRLSLKKRLDIKSTGFLTCSIMRVRSLIAFTAACLTGMAAALPGPNASGSAITATACPNDPSVRIGLVGNGWFDMRVSGMTCATALRNLKSLRYRGGNRYVVPGYRCAYRDLRKDGEVEGRRLTCRRGSASVSFRIGG